MRSPSVLPLFSVIFSILCVYWIRELQNLGRRYVVSSNICSKPFQCSPPSPFVGKCYQKTHFALSRTLINQNTLSTWQTKWNFIHIWRLWNVWKSQVKGSNLAPHSYTPDEYLMSLSFSKTSLQSLDSETYIDMRESNC